MNDSGVGTGRQVAEQGERWRKKKGRDECASHKLPVEWTLRHAAKMWGGNTLHQYRAGEDAMPSQRPVHFAICVASGWLVGSAHGEAAYDCRAKSRSTMGDGVQGSGAGLDSGWRGEEPRSCTNSLPRLVPALGVRVLSLTLIVACSGDRTPISLAFRLAAPCLLCSPGRPCWIERWEDGRQDGLWAGTYKKASAPIMRTAAHSCDPVVLPDSPSPPHPLYIHGVDLGLFFWEELMGKQMEHLQQDRPAPDLLVFAGSRTPC